MRWLVLVLATAMMTAGLAWATEGNGTEDDGDDGPNGKGRGGDRRDDARERTGEAREKVQEHFQKHGDKWVVQNEDLTIWFHQGDRSKPVLAVFRTGEDGNRSGFKMMLDELFEASAVAPKPVRNATGNGTGDDDPDDDDDDGNDTADDDGDGPAWKRVRGHRVNLHPAREWWTNVTNATDEVTITMGHLFNQGNVSLVFHVPKVSGAVKFDVLVHDWKWADANNTLALRLKVLEKGAQQRGPNATFDGGYVSWATTADVTYPGGATASIPVVSEVRNHGEGARILLKFNGTGGYSALDYDPTIAVQWAGSQQPANATPGAAAVFVVVAVAAVAVLAGTRRGSSR